LRHKGGRVFVLHDAGLVVLWGPFASAGGVIVRLLYHCVEVGYCTSLSCFNFKVKVVASRIVFIFQKQSI